MFIFALRAAGSGIWQKIRFRMNRIFILVGIGGFVGSVLRYYSQQVVSKFFPSALPYGTLAVNVAGCLLIGIIYGLSERGNALTPE